jgi:hypothetical protein
MGPRRAPKTHFKGSNIDSKRLYTHMPDIETLREEFIALIERSKGNMLTKAQYQRIVDLWSILEKEIVDGNL